MWIEYLRIAVGVLRGHKFRSLLTVFSITIGAFSIVLMSSLAESGLRTLTSGMEEIGGARLMALWSQPPKDRGAHRMSYTSGLTRGDLDLVRGLPHLAGASLIADFEGKDLISDTGQRFQTDLVGADPSFFRLFGYRIAEGRAFDSGDQLQHGRVCVVGGALAEKLAQDGRPVVGRSLSISGMRCQLVGSMAKVDRFGMRLGFDWDDVIVVPIEALADHSLKEVEQGRWLLMHSDDPANNEIIKRVINVLLRERHHGLNDFILLDFQKGFVEEFMKIFRIMKVLVGLLAGIALLVGGVGVMNIMLVSVSERVREIGVRKALGASKSDIGRQFLLEAVLLSSIGGCAGVVLGLVGGVAGGLIIQHLKPRWLIVLSEPAAIAALSVAVAVGLVFGYFPARRAGGLDPVSAIRSGN